MRHASILMGILVVTVIAYALTSTAGEFTVSPNTLYINWTNASGIGSYIGNITITNNLNYSVNFLIKNVTPLYNSLGEPVYYKVFNGTAYSNETLVENESSRDIFIQFDTSGLTAGRYTGNVTIYNSTNTSEKIDLPAILDVLIPSSGSFKGNISNSTETFWFNITDSNIAGFNISITDISDQVLVKLYKPGVSNPVETKTFSSDGWFDYNETALLSGIWKITVENSTASTTYNGTLRMNNASFIVNNFVTEVSKKENMGRNKTTELCFYVNNTDDDNVTVIGLLNSSFLNYSSSKYMEITGTNLTTGNITPGNYYYCVNVSIDTNKTGNQIGNYFGWFFINTSNGYPRNTWNLSLKIDLTNSLKVNITKVENATDGSQYTVPGALVNLSVVPKYQDDVFVSGLNISRFSNAKIIHNSISSYSKSITLNNVSEKTNYYWVNATIPSDAVGGNYTVSVDVSDGKGNSGTGTNDSLIINKTALEIRLVDPNTDQVYSDSISKTTSSTFVIEPTLYNYGPIEAKNVEVKFYVTSGSCTISGTNPKTFSSISAYTISDPKVNGTVTITTPSTNGTCTIVANSSTTGYTWYKRSKTITVTVTSSSTSEQEEQQNSGGIVSETQTISSISANGTASASFTGPHHITNIEVKVKNAASNVNITVMETSRPAGASDPADKVHKYIYVSTTNLDDSNIESAVIKFRVDKTWITANQVDPDSISLYRWKDNKWTKLPTEKTGSDSSWYYYKATSPGLSVFAIAGMKAEGILSIIDYPSSIEIIQGESKTVNVKVKNIGYSDVSNVVLEIEGLDSNIFTVSGAQDIAKDTEKTYTVTFTIPENMSIGEYLFNFKAKSGSLSAVKSSKLIILPNNDTKDKILETFQNYTNWFNRLYKLYNKTSKSANISYIKDNITKVSDLLDQVDGHIKLEEWIKADEKLSEIEDILSYTESELDKVNGELSRKFWGNVGKIVIFIVAIGIIVFVWYSYQKPKGGYHPGRGYKHVPSTMREKRRIEIIKEEIKKFIEKIKRGFRSGRKRKYSYAG